MIDVYGLVDDADCNAAVAHCVRKRYPVRFRDLSDPAVRREMSERIKFGWLLIGGASGPRIFAGLRYIGGLCELQSVQGDHFIQQFLGGK